MTNPLDPAPFLPGPHDLGGGCGPISARKLGDPSHWDEPIGVASEVKPDGSQEVVLNEKGKSLFGPNVTILLVPPKEVPVLEIPNWAMKAAETFMVGAPEWDAACPAIARLLVKTRADALREAAKIASEESDRTRATFSNRSLDAGQLDKNGVRERAERFIANAILALIDRSPS